LFLLLIYKMITNGAPILDAAWALLDPDQSGSVDPGVLVSNFRAHSHPWVISGRLSASDCLQSFLAECSVGGQLPGRATFNEFKEYFTRAYPPSLVSETEFQAIVRAVWGLSSMTAPVRSSPSPETTAGPPPPVLFQSFSSAPPPPSPHSTNRVEITAGLQPILNRLGVEAMQGGPRAFAALSRQAPPGGMMGLAQFKAAVKQVLRGANVADHELRFLFEHFESNASGYMRFDAFIDALKPPATFGARRRNAISDAFGALDRTRAGAVNAAVVVNAYRPAQHPEVLAGRMSAEAARAEFMDTFECGGEAEGLVTFDEFLRYHLSLPIEDDNSFEFLLRNTWGLYEANSKPSPPPPHEAAPLLSAEPAPPPPPPQVTSPPNPVEAAPSMPGSQGLEQPAGKSNQRVHDSVTFGLPLTSFRQPPAVPQAQGPEPHFNNTPTNEQPVTMPRSRREVLGRGERKLAELPRHLQSCLAITGHAVNESTALAQQINEAAGKRAGKMSGPGARLFGGSFNIFATDEYESNATAVAPPPPPPPWAVQPPAIPGDSLSGETFAPGSRPREATGVELPDKVLHKLSEKLKDQGLKACCHFGRALRTMDETGRGLDEATFTKSLREGGFPEISSRDAAALFRYLDRSCAGTLQVNEIFDHLYGPFPRPRARAVRAAFESLLKRARSEAGPEGEPTLDPATVARCFDPSGYPDERGADAAMAEFVDTFECLNGTVTWGAFIDYYKHLSFTVADDAVFEARVLGVWRASLPLLQDGINPESMSNETGIRFGAMQGSVIFNTTYGMPFLNN